MSTLLRRTPTSITIHPVSLFSILDHYLRRTDAQDRVIGTLLGIHTDNEVEVRSSFAVLHSETDEQVAVDTDYHQTMYELHHKVNPKEVIVGWLVYYYVSTAFHELKTPFFKVLNRIQSQHLFCSYSKFLFSRNSTSSSDTRCYTHWR